MAGSWSYDERMHFLETRFFKAIKDEDDQTIVALLKNEGFRRHMDSCDKLSLAFVQSVLLNSVRLLNVLVKNGVDISCTDCMFEENGVMHAARYGHTVMIQHLLSAGIGVNKQSQDGSTALHVAVENGRHECLRILAEQPGVDLDIQDTFGFSPLLWTATMRDLHGMKILIDAGCKVDSKDFKKGMNALHVCADFKRASPKGQRVSSEIAIKCMDLLVEGGLDINDGDVYSNPPVLYALHSHYIPALKKMLQLNCRLDFTRSPNTVYYFGDVLTGSDMTLLSLYIAIEKLQLDSVQLLCAAGVRYHRLAREPDIVAYTESRSEALHQWLVRALSTPVSLKQSCKGLIRRCVCGRSVDEVKRETGLPKSLAEYVFNIDVM